MAVSHLVTFQNNILLLTFIHVLFFDSLYKKNVLLVKKGRLVLLLMYLNVYQLVKIPNILFGKVRTISIDKVVLGSK